MIYLNIILLDIFLVLVFDIAGFRDTVKDIIAFFLSLYLKKNIRSKDLNFEVCVTCLSWWIGLFYLLFMGKITILLLTFNIFTATLTPIFRDFAYGIMDFLQYIVIKFDSLWTKQ